MARKVLPWLLLTFTARPAAAAVGDESVGVNAHNGAPEFIVAAQALGVRWVRLDANWNEHEPADDAYAWHLDAAVAQSAMAGLRVFLTLAYTPDWVARHGDRDGSAHNDVPNDSAAWVDFVTDAVTHYRALGVTHFGLWNEANLQGFWEGTIAEYNSTIVVPGAAAVRAACSDCKVLGPELAHVGDADDQLERVLSGVPAGTFDIVTHHSYNGFAETGWQIFDGDSYINVLDQQRFPFTRRSIRQVLDAVGYSGEVWMSETGYRAGPGNAAEEMKQAIYVRRVMEEQLLRAWVTNSFFYEVNDCGVDQPGCPIDGFGLMRPTAGSPGTRSFPADFRLKPAFLEIQGFIAAHPEVVGTQPPKQCGDGLDNDGDGRVDLADRGCGGPDDDLEADDPPRPALAVAPIHAVQLDGDLAEFAVLVPLVLGDAAWRGTEPLSGPADLSASVRVGYRADGLYLGVEVLDDVQQNDRPPAELWQSDSVQLAFDLGQSGGTGYDALDDHELNFALSGGASVGFRFHGPTGASDTFRVAVARAADRTRYEIHLPPAVLPGLRLAPGGRTGFSLLINEDDGEGRIGWLEWTPGIGTGKEPERFGELVLIDGPGGDDAGVADAAGAPDAASPADAAVSPDGATAGDAALADAGSGDAAAAPGDATTVTTQPGDCSCRHTPAPGGGAGWLLLAGLLLRRRGSR